MGGVDISVCVCVCDLGEDRERVCVLVCVFPNHTSREEFRRESDRKSESLL